jgi:hypothetical protein
VREGFAIRLMVACRSRFHDSPGDAVAPLSDTPFDAVVEVFVPFLAGPRATADAKRLGNSASADLAFDLIEVGVFGFHDRFADLKSSRSPLEYCFVGVDAILKY